MSFGGQAWPINPVDFNAGPVSNGRNPLCLGAIFDLGQGTGNSASSSAPTWVVGDTFLVYTSRDCTVVLYSLSFFLFFFLEKRVLGVPFLTAICWVCSVVYSSWRDRYRRTRVNLGLPCCRRLERHGYLGRFLSYWDFWYVFPLF